MPNDKLNNIEHSSRVIGSYSDKGDTGATGANGVDIGSIIPSRRCALCDATEYRNAVVIDSSFWLCEECREVLKRLVDCEKTRMRHERIMKQLEEEEL